MKSLIVIVCIVALTAAGGTDMSYTNHPAVCYGTGDIELDTTECHNAVLCQDMDGQEMDCPCNDGYGPRDCTPEE